VIFYFIFLFLAEVKLRKSLEWKWKRLDVFGIRTWCGCWVTVLKVLTGTYIAVC
jgi:hypothetical protein